MQYLTIEIKSGDGNFNHKLITHNLLMTRHHFSYNALAFNNVKCVVKSEKKK